MSEAACAAAPGETPQNLAGRARAAMITLLADHHRTGGRGPDAYHKTPITHPMAEGRFLAAAATAAGTRLISMDQLNAMAMPALQRLDQSALPFADGLGWGLGFSYGGTDKREPFLITTAKVAEGLMELAAFLPDQPLAARLLAGSLSAIESWCRTYTVLDPDLGMKVPVYSPKIRRPILNAAVYAIAVLSRGNSGLAMAGVPDAAGSTPESPLLEELQSWLCRIRDRRLPGIGWVYEPEAPVVDLLHQCFILNCLSCSLPTRMRDKAAEDLALVETMSLFTAGSGFLDTATLQRDPDLPPVGGMTLRRIGDAWLTIPPKPARLWSLGELLVSLSWRIADRDDRRADRWRGYATPACEALLARLAGDSDETTFPRHRMYAAFGLARFLAAVRGDHPRHEVGV